MTLKLDYKDEDDVGHIFYSVCPVSSGMRNDQIVPKDFPQFTIVAYIEKSDQKQFQRAIDILRIPQHRFRRAMNLHCTLLSLQTTKKRTLSNNIESIFSVVTKFFEEKNIGQIKINFCLVHPGKWRDHPNESDGTVIALGRKEDNQKFLNVVYELKDYLQKRFHNISFGRNYDTIWCTLGFFDEEDFKVDYSIYKSFNNPILRRFKVTTTIKEISITEFRLKSLDDGIKCYIIKL
jgi:hypothetical protein